MIRCDFVSNSSSGSFILVADFDDEDKLFRTIAVGITDQHDEKKWKTKYTEMNYNTLKNCTKYYVLMFLCDFEVKDEYKYDNEYNSEEIPSWCDTSIYGCYCISAEDVDKFKDRDGNFVIDLNEIYKKYKKSEDEYFCNVNVCSITMDTVKMTRAALANPKWQRRQYWGNNGKEEGITEQDIDDIEKALQDGKKVYFMHYTYSGDSIENGALWYETDEKIPDILSKIMSKDKFKILHPVD